MYNSNIKKKARKRNLVERLKTTISEGKVYNELCVKSLQTAIKFIKAIEAEKNWAVKEVLTKEQDIHDDPIPEIVWVGEGEPNEMAKATLLAIRKGADLAMELSDALARAASGESQGGPESIRGSADGSEQKSEVRRDEESKGSVGGTGTPDGVLRDGGQRSDRKADGDTPVPEGQGKSEDVAGRSTGDVEQHKGDVPGDAPKTPSFFKA